MKSDKKYLYFSGLGLLAIILLATGASPAILLLLACPIMMMFMMNGMNHGNTKRKMDHEKEE